MPVEVNLQKAYNEYRGRNDLQSINFSDNKASADHRLALCIECLLECFQARRVEKGNIELDEVSCYRNTILQGIGLTKHGHYARKLSDEMGIPRKRLF